MHRPSPDQESHSNTEAALAALDREAHVFLARPAEITDARLLDRYADILSKQELAREERLMTAELRHLFRVSHALVRTTLSRYAPVPPAAWEFCEGEYGRPEISGPTGVPPLRFNLSHTQGLIACLVCRDIDCGVDVERSGRVKHLLSVARRVFSTSEIADIQRHTGAAQQGRFTDFWVLKEAYIKARGMGFQLPLREITFTIQARGDIEMSFAPGFGDDPAHWHLDLRTPLAGEAPFRLGVALRCGGLPKPRILVREVVPDPDAGHTGTASAYRNA
jgi:4'-phosphopantetheinyl transferase